MNVLDYILMEYPSIFNLPRPWDYYLNEGMIDRKELSYLLIRDVGLIKIFQFGLGGRSSVAIYLKRSEDLPGGKDDGLGGKYFMLKGYTSSKEFKPSSYSMVTQGSKMNSLFWDPFVIISKQAPYHITLPENGSSLSKKLLIVEGLTSNGDIFFHKEMLE